MSNLAFIKYNNLLLLKYSPDNGADWIYDKFDNGDICRVKRTFNFTKDHLFNRDPYSGEEDIESLGYVIFVLAEIHGEYYKFDRSVLGLDVNLYMHRDIKFKKKMFMAKYNKSIFRVFNKIVNEDIRIGNAVDDIPVEVFKELIDNFPSRTELEKYVKARVSSTIREYVENSEDSKAEYEKYMNRYVKSFKGDNLLNTFAKNEERKYKAILFKLKKMLDDEINYTENQWQKEILQIIQLIYPKYIRAYDEVQIKDIYHNKKRRLDFLLVDSNGNIDIVEIKKPFDNKILSRTRYRDNYVPLRELSGSIMQVEKYIFYLNKWGKDGEKKLTEKFSEDLPNDFEIKIINPGAIIIMGRENNLTLAQLEDFEVIKRKYKNVVDIITYDELIKRIKQIIHKYNTLAENVS